MKNKHYSEILKRENELSEENRKKFDGIFMKIKFAHIDVRDGVAFLNDCLDKFQKAGEQMILPEEVFGTYDFDFLSETFIQKSRNSYSFSKKLYWEIQYIPLVLLIYLGLFEMGIKLMELWAGNGFTYIISVNTSMIINTFNVLIIIFFLLNQAHLLYMKLNSSDKQERRNCTLIFFIIFISFIIESVLINLYLSEYLFKVNYFIFLGIIAVVCIIQTLFENKELKQ